VRLIESLHGSYVHDRRSRILSRRIADVIPKNFSILDVGCGDGFLAQLISQARPDVSVTGIDVLVRERTYIPVHEYDGETIPYDDASFDGVMFVDVLHHTADPMVLLREAIRVSRTSIVVKDHTSDGLFADVTLRVMDKIGNARHGVSLPYNYWPRRKWFDAFATLGLQIAEWTTRLEIYPWPASWVFDRSLHFVARLDLANSVTGRLANLPADGGKVLQR
jgi:SAM-dependent methyltransferase